MFHSYDNPDNPDISFMDIAHVIFTLMITPLGLEVLETESVQKEGERSGKSMFFKTRYSIFPLITLI